MKGVERKWGKERERRGGGGGGEGDGGGERERDSGVILIYVKHITALPNNM